MVSTFPPDSDYATIAQLVEPPKIPANRTHSPPNGLKRSDPFQFGSRFLEEGDNVFDFNAWDHVETDPEYKAYAEIQYAKQRDSPVSDFDRNRFNANPARWWDLFYKNNSANFFKDRKWLCQEFPILTDVTRKGAGRKVVLEVGAGAGNTAFPLLVNNENDELTIHACDLSKIAVEVMRQSEYYSEKHVRADVWDVANEGEDSLPPGLGEESVDVVVLIFIFSALAPDQWNSAIRNIYRVLKPGGLVLFRDYGRGDLAQVRFKKNRYLAENFYVRGDGTRVYFFEEGEVEEMWGKWAPEKGLQSDDLPQKVEGGDKPMVADGKGVFQVLDLKVDRRLLVNRQRKLKMYRCWLQGRFQKRANCNESNTEPTAPTETTEKYIDDAS